MATPKDIGEENVVTQSSQLSLICAWDSCIQSMTHTHTQNAFNLMQDHLGCPTVHVYEWKELDKCTYKATQMYMYEAMHAQEAIAV